MPRPKKFRVYPLLKPLGWLYGSVMCVRNYLYARGLKRSYRADVSVVSVGNLSVGGTGKTPFCAWLISVLNGAGKCPAFLSRGYGRQSRGFVRAETTSSARDIGDEPLEIHQMFPDVPVCVCENRAQGSRRLLEKYPQTECIVLDDAFQHHRIRRDLDIVLTDYNRLYTRDLVLPAGRLREPRCGIGRANIVVVSKCPPELNSAEARAVEKELNLRPGQRLFFSSIGYKPLDIGPLTDKSVLLLTGIANPAPLIAHFSPVCGALAHIRFPDHHSFSPADIERIAAAAEKADIVITTGKDAARLPQDLPKVIAEKLHIQRIGLQILFNGEPALRTAIMSIFKHGQ